MSIFYKFLISGITFLMFSLACLGQQVGVVVTERNWPVGAVSFSETSKVTGISDQKHIDGYVKKYGSSRFVFPVGQNNSYRPFAAEAEGVIGAYFMSSPAVASLPAGAPFALNANDGSLKNVSGKEFWDVNGTSPTRLTFTWNSYSDIANLTGSSLSLLCIAGWNASTSRWEKITSTVDEIALLGGGSTLSAGSITTVFSIIPDNYAAYTLAASQSAVLPSNFSGNMEMAGCELISGWVWDKNYPEAALTVELVEGGTVLATAIASIYREDLKSSGIGTGKYGFNIQLPGALMGDGISHQLSVRVRGSAYILGGSPKTLSCAYGGNFDGTDCYTVGGWVWDKNNPDKSFNVELVESNIVHATVLANNHRNDLTNGTGDYGFLLAYPEVLKDGKAHQLEARVKGTNYILPGSPKTATCAVNYYQGNLDYADCNIVTGWAWNKNYPNSALTVELMEGTTIVGTALANVFSQTVKNAGYGTGYYGFSLAFPAALKDGKPHQLTLRVKGSSNLLPGSKSVTCAVNQYQGNLDYVDCNVVTGWAWDKNFPNSALTVELMEGTTVVGTALANVFSQTVKNAGYGTGYYGFSLAFPAALKDGKPHQLTLRVKGGSSLLPGSKSVTCAVNQYQGNLDYADCNVVTGWAWDKNFPNSALTVELMEGTTVVGTALANVFSQTVKNAGYGTGYYGFSLAFPAALKDGKPHQLTLRVKGGSSLLPGSKSVTCAVNQYQGNLDYADCNVVTGWAWDKNFPNSALTVELLEGTTVVGTALANVFSQTVKNAGYGTGYYGFSLPFPAALKDGNPHQLTLRVKGGSSLLPGSKSVTCAVNQYQGNLDYADCNVVTGWAWDKNFPNSALTVELLEGTTVVGTALANVFSQTVKNAGYGTGYYGFSLPFPAALKDGNPHQLTLRVKGGSSLLPGSKSVTCAVNQYQGNLDYADCNVVTGWAWDKNFPNSALTVELLEGTTVVGTALANVFSQTVKNAGYGTGYYGFSLPFPAALKDGNPHQLTLRVKGGSSLLPGSKSVTCAVNQYQGNLDYADCNVVTGWAWDKNFPNSALTVELLEGTTVVGTALANVFSQTVKNAGYGTGYYGFSLPFPAALKDGNPHQLTLRVKGGSSLLPGSKSVTCAVNQYQGNLDYADCNVVTGWAWDKNFPNAAVTVELVESNIVHASVIASSFKETLKTVGPGATGNYGFIFAIPAALKNGQSHQLSVRVKGANYILSSSPRTLTCNSPARLSYETHFDVIDTNEQDLFSVAPNPTSTKIRASFLLPVANDANLYVASLLGNIVWQKKIIGTGERCEQWIDLSNEQSGMYIVILKTAERAEARRIVLAK